MTDERMAEQMKAADAALRATLTRLIRDDGIAPVSVVVVLATLVGEIAVDDAATDHGCTTPTWRWGRCSGRYAKPGGRGPRRGGPGGSCGRGTRRRRPASYGSAAASAYLPPVSTTRPVTASRSSAAASLSELPGG